MDLRVVRNRVFAPRLRYSVHKREKTRFLWYVCVIPDRRKFSKFSIINYDKIWINL